MSQILWISSLLISQRTFTNATNATPSFINTQNLSSTSISIFKIRFPRVWIVTQLSIKIPAFLEIIPEKNPTNVRNAAKPLPIVPALDSIIGFILVSNITYVRNVAKPSTISHSLRNTRASMPGRSPTAVNFVAKHLIRDQLSLNTRGFILESGPTIVKTVAKLFIRGQALAYTREFTLERNPTNAKNAAKPSTVIHSLLKPEDSYW